MMKRILTVAAGLALVMGLSAAWMPAHAVCSAARLVTSSTLTGFSQIATPGNPFFSSYLQYVRPGGGTVTYFLNGEFWAFGTGNPAVGPGDDSGAFKGGDFAYNWLALGYYYNTNVYPAFMNPAGGHWNSPGVDGCIDNTSPTPANRCNVVLLQDSDGHGSDSGFFALLAVAGNAGGDYEYTATTGFPASIALAPIPKPMITGSARIPPDDVSLTVMVSTPISPLTGFYLNCSPAQNAALPDGYRLYARKVPRDTPKPVAWDTRWIAQGNHEFPSPGALPVWTPLDPNPGTPGVFEKTPLGVPANVVVQCTGNEDIWIGTALTFGGVAPGAANYETKIVSQNSTKIQCGPDFAEPKPLERPRPGKPTTDRPTPRR
jgi:hypothetical protein